MRKEILMDKWERLAHMACVAAVTCMCVTALPWTYQAQAADVQTNMQETTVQVADGLSTGNDGAYYYYKDGNVVTTAGWYDVDSQTKVQIGNGGVVQYVYNTATGKMTAYSGNTYTAVSKKYIKLDDGKMYYFNSNGIKVTKSGWQKISSTTKVKIGKKGYVTMKFSTKTGKLLKYSYSKGKWVKVKVTSYKIGSKRYYFKSNGLLAKNTIVGSAKKGYFYVDETGCKVTSKEIQLAVNFVKKHTTNSMTRQQKLKACFTYLSRNYPYLRDYTTPTNASRFSELAIDMLTNNHGNCYRCAATFACVATVLGYDARVTCGKVTNLQGTGLTIHGWTELWSEKDKQWIVYDVSMQRNWPARNYYHIYMKNYYPNNRVVGPRARLTVKNGKVNWRWLKDSELKKH